MKRITIENKMINTLRPYFGIWSNLTFDINLQIKLFLLIKTYISAK